MTPRARGNGVLARQARRGQVVVLAVLVGVAVSPPAMADLGDAGPRIDWQWNMMNVRATTARVAAVDPASVVVAVIDTGVDFGHPDLADARWSNEAEVEGNGEDDDGNGYVDDVHGWDWCTNGDAGAWTDAHGTHVAGIVGATGRAGNGLLGVAPGVRIMSLRVLCEPGLIDSRFLAVPDLDMLAAAVRYAAEMGADVAVMSLLWNPQEPRQLGLDAGVLRDEFDAARDAGVFLVAAAGNTGGGTGEVTEPASYESVFSVSAVGLGNHVPGYAATKGKIDLWAPGGSDWAEIHRGMVYSTMPDGYGWLSGTSMAAPHVAGAAALLKARDPAATPDTLAARLVDASFDLGNGRRLLDVAEALGVPYSPPSARLLSPADGDTVARTFAPRVAYEGRSELYDVRFFLDDEEIGFAMPLYAGALVVRAARGAEEAQFSIGAFDGRQLFREDAVLLNIDPELEASGLDEPVMAEAAGVETSRALPGSSFASTLAGVLLAALASARTRADNASRAPVR